MTLHKVRAVIRVVVCDCGWQARSDHVVSLDKAFRDHQSQQALVGLRKHLSVAMRADQAETPEHP